MITRRQLPILSACQQFVGRSATDDEPAYCTNCSKHVHDLSRMKEREVIGLLARHLGERVCISYRSRADGTIALRATPSRFAPVALAVALAGCAGHVSDGDDVAKTDCVDAAGYEVPCPSVARVGIVAMPDTVAPPPVEPVAPPSDDTNPVKGGLMVPEVDAPPLDGEIVVDDRAQLDPGLMKKVRRERARLDRKRRG